MGICYGVQIKKADGHWYGVSSHETRDQAKAAAKRLKKETKKPTRTSVGYR